ncbi:MULTISPECIES: class I adenylate-forming enzyme family protein [unclassified Pseudofrankia]|uniref:class I adenylate-forming enzyme family protein n=1 Tax=unclassified Pseudofrankia TaxID=2994372 RepID=UPI0008D9828A|nr:MULTISPECIES: class I adenylate-forming enzyme family protein [unclassified Pseudofrankia]MDT3446477.1 class I adenylate-forming enzyme family protein [Pseudofrankia sp. BMG5.37]OHV45172.1 AMP-dependent synthetase [Pseudofrankia sp. BMG5.36]
MLRWPDGDLLPPPLRDRLMGPAAPFELAREQVRGIEMTVFARRPPHLPAMLAAACRRFPDRPYLVFTEADGAATTLTFAETAARAVRIAGVLRDKFGVRKGDRVGFVAANCAEYAAGMWAALSLGAIAIGLNGWWTGPELAHGLRLTTPTVVFGDERRLARLEGIPEATNQPVLTFAELFAALPAADDEADTDGAEEVAAALLALCPDLREDDPVTILFTSGTTGRPKGALVPHRALVNFSPDAALRGAARQLLDQAAQARAQAQASPASQASPAQAPAAPPPPVAILAGPFFHISGIGPLLSHAPYNGMTLVFAPPGKWDPTVHLDLTARYGVTNWSGVPTQFLRLLEHPRLDEYDLSSLRGLGGGGAALPPEVVRLIERVLPGRTLGGGYGMTETAGIGATTGGSRLRDAPGSLGVATPTSEIRVIGPDGAELPDGEVGEICVRCPSVFLGYWENEEATAAVLDADGWYRTGDFGRTDGGLLYLESRLRDMIIRGGENIYPIEIENRLVEHPGLADAAVIGVEHRELGQEVLAVVVRREGADVTAGDVQAWVAAALARFKVPAHVRFATELPYNATGKLLKRELEKLYASASESSN